MARGEDTRHHPNRKVGSPVGIYQGSVGRTHLFTADDTNGDSTDSLQASDTTEQSWSGVVGKKYAVPSQDSRHLKPID